MAEAVLPLWLVRTYEEGLRRALATAAVREEQERHRALKRAALAAAGCWRTTCAGPLQGPGLHVLKAQGVRASSLFWLSGIPCGQSLRECQCCCHRGCGRAVMRCWKPLVCNHRQGVCSHGLCHGIELQVCQSVSCLSAPHMHDQLCLLLIGAPQA